MADIRRFVAATKASFELAAREPDAAIAALLAMKPSPDRELSMLIPTRDDSDSTVLPDAASV